MQYIRVPSRYEYIYTAAALGNWSELLGKRPLDSFTDLGGKRQSEKGQKQEGSKEKMARQEGTKFKPVISDLCLFLFILFREGLEKAHRFVS